MCGIMGYVGHRGCVDIVFNGLKRLEYRGYDSAGVAVLEQGQIALVKAEGKLKNLEPKLSDLPKHARIGIGHTRWATHGVVNATNAHPHVLETLGIVHNGIIENFKDLKAGLEAAGTNFQTETDTEVILHLLNRELETADPKQAILNLTKTLKGAYSLGVIVPKDPEALYLVKQGSPLAIGLGKGENFFGSDAAALVEHTHRAIFLADGELVRMTAAGYEIWDFSGKPITKCPAELHWSAEAVEKRGFAHFMLKEIYEQPAVLTNLVSRLVDLDRQEFMSEALGLAQLDTKMIDNVQMLACGTAYFSCLIGKYMLESLAKLPVNVELASEFRYRDPFINQKSLSIAVSQSGETMDTLESTKYAKQHGSQIHSICNVPYSSITREANGVLYMDVGPEIGVASTKAFTGMVLSQCLVAMCLAEKRGLDMTSQKDLMCSELRLLPTLIDKILSQAETLDQLAEKYVDSHSFLFIGRGENFPIALEGALKLKEISYIHAEGYAAGELKHGPIALIDHNMPLLALAPQDRYYDKVFSNIEQVKARNGRVMAIGNENNQQLAGVCDDVFLVPRLETPGLQAILTVIPLQLFSYYVALRRGTDVDQPRNLAKSVTVE